MYNTAAYCRRRTTVIIIAVPSCSNRCIRTAVNFFRNGCAINMYRVFRILRGRNETVGTRARRRRSLEVRNAYVFGLTKSVLWKIRMRTVRC